MTGCRIGNIKPKSGGATIRVLESSVNSMRKIDIGYGMVTVDFYGVSPTNADVVYMLEAAKRTVMDVT